MENTEKQQNGQTMHLILIILFLFLTLSLIIKGCSSTDTAAKDPSTLLPQSPNINVLPSDPNVAQLEASASIGITGSFYIQNSLLEASKISDGEYDFSTGLATISHSYGSYDYMIAHLETTFAGTTGGEYSGEEKFNTPDSLLTAAKNAGINMMITANDHSYDTGRDGLIRTQEVIKQAGLDYTGTRLTADSANYIIKNINGIKIGMISYTFETGDKADGTMTLGNLPVNNEDADLINTFNYTKSEQFYTEVKTAKEEMDAAGADVVIFFIHWGNEYDLKPSATQKKIAQNLCEIGYDFIIGSNPHNVQSMELLTSESGKNTYCIYSLGNGFSAQRRTDANLSPKGHTEDGLILGIKFEKWSDGTFKIANLNATPLWTDAVINQDTAVYTIIPVDVTYNFYPALGNYADRVNSVIDPDRDPSGIISYTPADLSQINASYTRTMDIVLTGLNECRQALGLNPVSNISGN